MACKLEKAAGQAAARRARFPGQVLPIAEFKRLNQTEAGNLESLRSKKRRLPQHGEDVNANKCRALANARMHQTGGAVMTESCFAKSRHQPTTDEIRSALDSCFPLWERLNTFIKKSYRIEGTWSKWGPAKSGWNLRYRRKGKSLTALHPQRKRILAQIVLGKAQAEHALQLDLGEKVSRLLRETPQLRDGRWLFIPVTSESDAKDVEKLLLAKMRPPRST